MAYERVRPESLLHKVVSKVKKKKKRKNCVKSGFFSLLSFPTVSLFLGADELGNTHHGVWNSSSVISQKDIMWGTHQHQTRGTRHKSREHYDEQLCKEMEGIAWTFYVRS